MVKGNWTKITEAAKYVVYGAQWKPGKITANYLYFYI
jgi:hypothetical protein